METKSSTQPHLKQRQAIILGSIIFFLLIVFIVIQFIINLPKTANLKLLVAPIDAKIEINQKTYRSGDHRIEPGTYRLKIKREGFKSEEIEFTVEKGKTKYLYYCLTPDQDHQQWFKDHKRDQDVCDQVDQALNDIEKEETMSDPIFRLTPYHSDEERFYIDSELNSDQTITIRIRPLSCRADLKKILYQNALDYLKSNHIDLEKYHLEYKEDC